MLRRDFVKSASVSRDGRSDGTAVGNALKPRDKLLALKEEAHA
jgi:hypothetical protein